MIMNRIKDILNRGSEDERKIKRSFVRYAIVLTAAMLVFFLFKTDNIFRWIEAGITVHRQERKIENLRKEAERLDARTKLLTNDRDTLEQYAREELGFAEPGDDVYIIKDK